MTELTVPSNKNSVQEIILITREAHPSVFPIGFYFSELLLIAESYILSRVGVTSDARLDGESIYWVVTSRNYN
jgi:hypothetical protein